MFPAQVTLLDPRSGVRQHRLDITPGDKAGLRYGNLVMTPDGRSYACPYRRTDEPVSGPRAQVVLVSGERMLEGSYASGHQESRHR